MRLSLASIISALAITGNTANAADHGAHMKRHHDASLQKREIKLDSLPTHSKDVANNVTTHELSKRFSNARFSFYDVGLYALFIIL